MNNIVFYSRSTIGEKTSENLRSVRPSLKNGHNEAIQAKKATLDAINSAKLDFRVIQANNKDAKRLAYIAKQAAKKLRKNLEVSNQFIRFV